MLTGSIGMLPQAILESSKGRAGTSPAMAARPTSRARRRQPLATILSVAMMLRFSLNQAEAADRIETAVKSVLAQGLRTPTSTAKASTKGRHCADGDAGEGVG